MTRGDQRSSGRQGSGDGVDACTSLEEHDRYVARLDTLPTGLAIHVRGTVVYANAALLWMLGYARDDDFIGRSIFDFVHPDHHAETARRVQTMYELSDGAGWWELQFLRADGTALDVEVAASVSDWKGEQASQVVVTDISARKAAEQERRASDLRYRTLLQAMPIGLAVLVDDELVFVNPAAARILGATDLASLQRRRVMEFVHPDDRAEIERRTNLLSAGASFLPPHETRLVRDDGSEVLAETSISRVEWGGEPAIQVLLRDVTERARMRQLVEHASRHESLSLLAGGVAHDFNNLLVGILGNTDLAMMDLPADAPTRAYLDDIALAARRAADLARQMLAYAGKGRVAVSRLDLRRLLADTATLLETAIARRARLTLSPAADTPAVEADEAQLRQVLLDLVGNSAEALGERGGWIELSTGVDDLDRNDLARAYLGPSCAPGRYAWFEVADNGPGIPPDQQGRIFDPFYSTRFTGRGLGLASVVGVVRAHGGAIRLDSAPGRGTRFRVLLPAIELDGADEVSVDDGGLSEDTVAVDVEGSVLVVDDEEMVRVVGATMLRRSGFTVITAADGPTAIAMCRAEPDRFDAVVLDLTMPGMDGVLTLGELRGIRPDLPVVLTSGYDPQEVLRQIDGEPPAGFVQKPFQSAALIDAVRRAMG